MSITTIIKNGKIEEVVGEIVENLKKLPQSKQEYVSGYVQGLADAAANKAVDQKESA